LLLVIDRRDDPVTPLLNQWTYQVTWKPFICFSLVQMFFSNLQEILWIAGNGSWAYWNREQQSGS
jgi:hypothetical protein